MIVDRSLQGPVVEDLREKMVFVVGPRQVGKTTMAKRILERHGPGRYLTWDRREDRSEIRAGRWPPGEALVVLDELHKYRLWKRWIKGEFDAHGRRLRFLVTGSARMDVYRRGGDSLQGRYRHYRLHPFSLAEIRGAPSPLPPPGEEPTIPEGDFKRDLEPLMRYGGFPEPFLAQSDRAHRRWQKDRTDRFFREDVRDLEAVRELSGIQLMTDLLAERVGSPLSLNSLREDLDASHRAVAHWLDVLERLYFAFRVRPFESRRVRSLKKRPKVYLWDWTPAAPPGPRAENLVASHLLKFCHHLEDVEGRRTELFYLRDEPGRETDFLVACDRRPWFAVEVKATVSDPDRSLLYFGRRLAVPFLYQVGLEGNADYVKDGVRCLPVSRFLAGLA